MPADSGHFARCFGAEVSPLELTLVPIRIDANVDTRSGGRGRSRHRGAGRRGISTRRDTSTSRVASGRDALDAVRSKAPDLIVLDVMLPHVDGLEVCRLLRANDSTAAIPIIMLTARAEESERIVGLEMGADDYLAKPFSPNELVARVRALLRRRTASRRAVQPPADLRPIVSIPTGTSCRSTAAR